MSFTTADIPQRALTPAGWVALGVVYVVWGSTYLGIGVLIETIPPLLGAGARFLIAAAILAGVLLVWGGPGALRVSPRRLIGPSLVGLLLLTFGNGMVGIAEQHIPTGLAALLVASVPLWLVVFRRVVGDRPPVATVAGVLVGFAGLALLTLSQGQAGGTSALGVAAILVAALSWATGSFLSPRLPMPDSPFVAAVYEMIAGGLVLLALGYVHGEATALDIARISTASWLALGYLITFGSLLAFTSYVWLLGNAPISLVGTYAYVNPTVAVLLGVLILGESVTWAILIGGGVIVAGVGLVVSTERRPRRLPAAPETEPA